VKARARLSDPDASLAGALFVLSSRRRFLQGLAGATLGALALRAHAACSPIPEETDGPFPGDGSNGPNALAQAGIVRSDIRTSVGSGRAATAAGTPLRVTLRLQGASTGCTPLAGRAVYVWHCDALGRYSLYSSGVEDVSYLRGVQAAGPDGVATFTSVFPGAYPGRWPHVHFEIYESLQAVASGAQPLRTSQIALPEEAARAVYAQQALYPRSARNLGRMRLADDMVFADDGAVLELPRINGSVDTGYAIELPVAV
jgi:protocatechuate 3,4-dioxygenase beta subunit